jgi:glycosyltransferase involved in cell wall biosynthesis
VLFVGRLSPEKGVGDLLGAWAHLGDAARLKVVGDGPLAGLVRQAVARDGRIEFLGQQPRARVLELMREAGALAFPSRWFEGMPMVLLEALAVGLPVVASRLGGIPALIADGETGRCFTPGDSHDLAAKLAELFTSSDLAAMRAAARCAYLAQHTATQNYQRLMEIYERAVAGAWGTPRVAA